MFQCRINQYLIITECIVTMEPPSMKTLFSIRLSGTPGFIDILVVQYIN